MATDTNRKISKLFIVPQRYILAIMCCIGITISYAIRYGFLVILIFLSVPAKKTQIHNRTCLTEDVEYNSTDTAINAGNRYQWDGDDLHLMATSFYWFFPVTQIFGGVVADQYGGKHTIGIPIFLIMVISFITPFIIIWSEGNRNILIAIRAITGLIEGLIYPPVYSILAQWVPKCERTFIASLSLTGMSLGKAMASSVTKFIILSTKYWPSAFYLYGIMSLVWFIAWNLICYSSPETHPFISDKEKEYLKRQLDGHTFLGRKKIPVWPILKSVPLWATVLVQFGQSWISFAMIAKLPVFVRMMHRINEEDYIPMDTIPYLCLVPFCLIFGLFSDWIVNKNYLTITTIRKVLTTIGSMGPGIFIFATTLLECNRTAIFRLFCVGMVLKSGFFVSSELNPLDLAPNFAGLLKGIVNTLTVIVGLIGPEMEYKFTNKVYERNVSEWRLIFFLAFAIMTLTNFAYIVIGNSEEQAWNKLELQREDLPADLDNRTL